MTQNSLFKNLIDYAGLFPPAKLDMQPAVDEYARQRVSSEAWMLARFIVPVARLDEFRNAANVHFVSGDPWPLSVLAVTDEDRSKIDAFNAANAGRAVVEAVETRATTAAEVAERAKTFAGLETYVEIPYQGDIDPLLAAIAAEGLRAKIRTGGVTADAFPASPEVARFLAAAQRAGVAMKATAGLHHALRGEYRLTYENDSPNGTMHGFLNVFLAAALARSGGTEQELAELLEERDANAFSFSGDAVVWRGNSLDVGEARKNFTSSYGSCSFQEPVDELRDLGLLPTG